MANYTLKPDNDKKQVNGSAITSGSTRIDGGTATGLGVANPTNSALSKNLQLGNSSAIHGSQVVQSKDLFGSFHTSAVTLSSVANNGGKCRFTKSSHGLTVGTVISVTGSTSGNVDGVQKITAVPTANTFDTDKTFTTSATAGVYKKVSGRFANMTVKQYIMRGYSQNVASGQKTFTGYGADYGISRSIHKLESMRTLRVATAIRAGYWNRYSGKFTTAPTNANDITDFGTDQAATPTRAIPGELVYRVSGQPDGSNGIEQADYPEKTNG